MERLKGKGEESETVRIVFPDVKGRIRVGQRPEKEKEYSRRYKIIKQTPVCYVTQNPNDH